MATRLRRHAEPGVKYMKYTLKKTIGGVEVDGFVAGQFKRKGYCIDCGKVVYIHEVHYGTTDSEYSVECEYGHRIDES